MKGAAGRVAAACALVAIVAGCATAPPTPSGAVPIPESLDISTFEVSGRLSVRNGERSDIGNFRLQREGARLALELLTPLGGTVARIDADDRGAQLTRADGSTLQAASIDALASRELGMDVPVPYLSAWLFGRPAPAQQANVTRDETGRVSRIEQAGWTVVYDAYSDAAGYLVPKRLTVTRGETVARFVLDTWQLNLAAANAASRP